MDFVKPFIRFGLYPLMSAVKGNKVRKYMEEFRKNDSLSHEKLSEMQKQKLIDLLLHCIKNVEAYKEFAYLEDEIFQNPYTALEKFPVLTKDDFKANTDAYISKTAKKEDLILNTTGGSTGNPTHFYMDRFTVEHYEASRFRGLSWWGIMPESRSVMFWANQLELSKSQSKSYYSKEKYLKNRTIISAYKLEPAKMSEYVEQINKYKPEYLYGYSSALSLFAKLMKEQNLKLSIKLKAIVSTTEALTAENEAILKEVFECKVVNEYGARDAGILGMRCPSENMHVPMENAHIEIVDVKTHAPIAKGQTGKILVTDLNNYVQPRLRYDLGDTGALNTDDFICSCQRHSITLKKISGRTADIFVTVDGVLVYGDAFNTIMKKMPEVNSFQVRQSSPDKIHVKLVSSTKQMPEAFNGQYKIMQDLFPKTEITTELVDAIPLSSSGKHRYAIREFDL